LGRAAFCSNDGLNLTEPLKPVRGFCLGFGLAERRMIVTSRRQLVQLIVAAPLCDTGIDIDTAGPFECRHGRSLLGSLGIGNLGPRPHSAVIRVTRFAIGISLRRVLDDACRKAAASREQRWRISRRDGRLTE
jgi:hypothetical protein